MPKSPALTINNINKLRIFLYRRDKRDAVLISSRIALRDLIQVVDEVDDEESQDLLVLCFRALQISHFSVFINNKETRDAATDALFADHIRFRRVHGDDLSDAIMSINSACKAASDGRKTLSETSNVTRYSPNVPYSQQSYVDPNASFIRSRKQSRMDDGWHEILEDVDALHRGFSASAIANSKLWSMGNPEWFNEIWIDARRKLNEIDGVNWKIWTEWYDDRLTGRSTNLAVENRQVLIGDTSFWSSGARVVNSELAKIRELNDEKSEVPGTPPDLPGPIKFKFEDGVLRLSPAPVINEEVREKLFGAWLGLVQITDDLLEHIRGEQYPGLLRRIQRYRDALGEDLENLNVLLLGTHGDVLAGLSARTIGELSTDNEVGLSELAAKHSLFLASFDEWRAYQDGISEAFASNYAEAQAVDVVAQVVEELGATMPEMIDKS